MNSLKFKQKDLAKNKQDKSRTQIFMEKKFSKRRTENNSKSNLQLHTSEMLLLKFMLTHHGFAQNFANHFVCSR